MNRRQFLQLGAATAALFVCPRPAVPAGLSKADLRRIVGSMREAAIEGDYFAFLHQGSWDDFVSITRRGQWADAYRAWRKLGKPGDADARSIWERYGKTIDLAPVMGSGEMGRFEGVRFIENTQILRPMPAKDRHLQPWQELLPARERRWM